MALTGSQDSSTTDELNLGRREGSNFDVVIRGYDREQVEERLAQWSDALDYAESQRNVAIEELEALKTDVAQRSPAQQVSERLRHILALAEEEADEIRVKAEEEVRGAVERARAESAAVREKAHADLRRDTANAQKEATRLVRDAGAQAAEKIAAAQAEAKDLSMQTGEARKGAIAEHQALLAAQKKEHEALRSRLGAEVDELERRRDEVRAQVSQLRDALAASVGGLPPENEKKK